MTLPLLFTGELHRHPSVLDLAARVDANPRSAAYHLMELWQWGRMYGDYDNMKSATVVPLQDLDMLTVAIPDTDEAFWLAAVDVGLIQYDRSAGLLLLSSSLLCFAPN